jgi:hypothetical protein
MDIIHALLLFSHVLSLCILVWGVLVYIRVCRGVAIVQNIVKRSIKMNIDDILFDDERVDPAAAVPSPAAAGPPPHRCRQKARKPSGTGFWRVSIIIQGQKRDARAGRRHERC